MYRLLTLTAASLVLAASSAASARSSFQTPDASGGRGELSPVLQCVPYARQVSGIGIYGDAHTWWQQAKNRYSRGNRPKIGAVMAMRPHGNSRMGHVEAVSGILDSRTILLRHANWSKPGLIEDNVKAVDVSARNDWSTVRIWHGPSDKLGSAHWPLYGFIYNKSGKSAQSDRTRRSNDLIADIIAGRLR